MKPVLDKAVQRKILLYDVIIFFLVLGFELYTTVLCGFSDKKLTSNELLKYSNQVFTFLGNY